MKPPVRTVVFGSLYGGAHLLKFLSSEELVNSIEIIGVATDDPRKPFTHPDVRLWRYAHTHEEEFMVRECAAELGIPVYTGSVRCVKFQRIFQSVWNPQLCLMATFGQKIPPCLYRYPRLGFYNCHHSTHRWPSYPGPTPIEEMIRDGHSHLVLTMHEVSKNIDDGKLVAHSKRIRIPPGMNPVQMHAHTWPKMKAFITRQVGKILEDDKGPAITFPLMSPEFTPSLFPAENSLIP